MDTTKTLFMAARNPQAILVIIKAGKLRSRKLRFADEHAALDWCLASRATFTLVPAGAPDPAAN